MKVFFPQPLTCSPLFKASTVWVFFILSTPVQNLIAKMLKDGVVDQFCLSLII